MEGGKRMNLLSKFRDIDTLIFDVDGVFTNSNLLITETGELLRTMNTRDGYAVKKALEAGLRVAIITGGSSKGVTSRLQGLGVVDIYAGIQHKIDAFDEYILTYDLQKSQILYMGDDLPDQEVMMQVGMPVCPVDAVPEIKAVSKYVSPLKGGYGCVRDVIEKVLKLRGQWS